MKKIRIVTEIQFQGRNVRSKDIETAVKADLTAAGLKIKDVGTLNIYYKPEEDAAYYVAFGRDGNVILEGCAASASETAEEE